MPTPQDLIIIGQDAHPTRFNNYRVFNLYKSGGQDAHPTRFNNYRLIFIN
ncbi:hypothetical protein [Dolichospermum circinale]|nr:hypothetical protein [Dolichospermum circinale]